MVAWLAWKAIRGHGPRTLATPVVAAALGFWVALLAHRAYWSVFIEQPERRARFEFILPDWTTVRARTGLVLESIPASVVELLHIICSNGMAVGMIGGGVLALLCTPVFLQLAPTHAAALRKVAALCFLTALTALATVWLLSVLSGQVSVVLPRRYGHGALTFSLLGIGCLLMAFTARWGRYLVAMLTFLVLALTTQLLAAVVVPSREIDRLVFEEVSRIIWSSDRSGVYLYVASDLSYETGAATVNTVGPMVSESPLVETVQTPLMTYWTAQHYAVHVLGAPFGAMLPSDIAGEPGNAFGRPPALQSGDKGVVIANLGMEPNDEAGRQIRVFKTYEDFEPHRFSRRIERVWFKQLRRGKG